MKKGFTLVELLAVLVILGAIILVAVPSLISTNKASEENEYSEFKTTIENAAEAYVEIHPDKYADLKNGTTTSVTISTETLVSAGLVEGNMVNPQTENRIISEASYVSAQNNSGVITYTYVAG